MNDIDIKSLRDFTCPMAKKEFWKLHQARSLSYQDAEVLCAIIGAFKPTDILELGTFVGLGSKVMAMAMRENGFGQITTADLWGPGERFAGPNSPRCGEKLDERDLEIVTLVTADEIEYLKSIPAASVDMVFEDTNHAARMLWKAVPLIERALRPGGLALFHNSNWQSVRFGLELAGVTDRLHDFGEINGASIAVFQKGES